MRYKFAKRAISMILAAVLFLTGSNLPIEPVFASGTDKASTQNGTIVIDEAEEGSVLVEDETEYAELKDGFVLNSIFRAMAGDTDISVPNETITEIRLVDAPFAELTGWDIGKSEPVYAYYITKTLLEEVEKQGESEPAEESGEVQESQESQESQTEETSESSEASGSESSEVSQGTENSSVSEESGEEHEFSPVSEEELNQESSEGQTEPSETPLPTTAGDPAEDDDTVTDEKKEEAVIFIYSEKPMKFSKDSSGAFKNLAALTNIEALSKISFKDVEDASEMFMGDKALEDISYLVAYKADNIKSANRMFYGCEKLEKIDALKITDVYASKTVVNDGVETKEQTYSYTAWQVNADADVQEMFAGTKVKEESYPIWYVNAEAYRIQMEAEKQNENTNESSFENSSETEGQGTESGTQGTEGNENVSENGEEQGEGEESYINLSEANPDDENNVKGNTGNNTENGSESGSEGESNTDDPYAYLYNEDGTISVENMNKIIALQEASIRAWAEDNLEHTTGPMFYYSSNGFDPNDDTVFNEMFDLGIINQEGELVLGQFINGRAPSTAGNGASVSGGDSDSGNHQGASVSGGSSQSGAYVTHYEVAEYPETLVYQEGREYNLQNLGIGDWFYWGNHQFWVTDQTGTFLAYCMMPSASSPLENKTYADGLGGTFYYFTKADSLLLIKALWYAGNVEGAPNIAKQVCQEMNPGYDADLAAYFIVHYALGQIYYEQYGEKYNLPSDFLHGVGAKGRRIINEYIRRIKARPDSEIPDEAYAVVAIPDDPNRQHMTYLKVPESDPEPIPMSISIQKASTDPGLEYSLEGAVFEIYADKNCQNLIARLKTDSTGKTPAHTWTDKYRGEYVDVWIKETVAPQKFYRSTNVEYKRIYAGENQVVTFMDEPMVEAGRIKIKKLVPDGFENDSRYTNLAGAVFGVYDNELCQGDPLAMLVTDENGETQEISVEQAGTYYVKELQGPSSGYYEINEEIQSSSLMSGQTVTFTVTDQPRLIPARLRVHKTSTDPSTLTSAYHSLEHAVFNICTDESGENVIATVTTNQEGYTEWVTIEEPGTYWVHEVAAPRHYVLKTEPMPVPIAPGEDKELDFANEPEYEPQYGYLTLKKSSASSEITDGDTNYSLAGAIYVVYSDPELTTSVGTLTTDEYGNTNTLTLIVGTYYIQEYQAPDGFKKSAEVLQAEVTRLSTEQKTSLETPYPKTEIEVYKYDEAFGTPIAGAEFTVYAQNGEEWTELGKMTYAGAGIYKSGTLYADETNPTGVFKVVETKVPDGYVEPATPWEQTFTAVADYLYVYKVNVSNQPEPYDIWVNKIDEDTGTSLQGADIRIAPYDINLGEYTNYVQMTWDETEQKYHAQVVPDENNIGYFMIKEFAAPSGYSSTYQEDFRITQNSPKVLEFTAENYVLHEYGRIVVKKENAVTGANVGRGAVFNVYEYDQNTGAYKSEIYDTLVYNNRTGFYESTIKCYRYDRTTDPSYNMGKYKVVEAKAPTGYINDGWSQEFEIPADENYNTCHFFYETQGVPTFVCQDATNEFKLTKTAIDGTTKLAGAQFTLTNLNTGESTAYTTDANGEITVSGLAEGYYQYVETVAPSGFELDSTAYYFTVSADGRIDGAASKAVSVTNAPSSELVIVKKDASLNAESTAQNPIYNLKGTMFPYGAEFTVYEAAEADGSAFSAVPYAVMVQTSGGFVNKENGGPVKLKYTLANGGYFKVSETKWPEGYIHTATEQVVRVPAGGQTQPITVTFSNTPNSYNIFKTNEAGTAMPGVSFKIWQGSEDNPTTVITRTTADNGNNEAVITLERIPSGMWYFKETATLQGYGLDKSIYSFFVDENGKIDGANTSSAAIQNYPYTKLIIIKKDALTGSTSERISGFPNGTEFDVFEWSEELGGYKQTPYVHVIYSEDEPAEFSPQGDNMHVDNCIEDENNAGELNAEYDIALIDTGASLSDNVIARYSVVGSNLADENGHGDFMARTIAEEAPEARIVSIKVAGKSGNTSVENIISAVKLAISLNVKIINISMAAGRTDETEKLEEVVNKAVKKGIAVVGAAGNGGYDANDCVPGFIESAIIVTACDEDGNVRENANVGTTVDFAVEAWTTSEAAARTSGIMLSGDSTTKMHEVATNIVPQKHMQKQFFSVMALHCTVFFTVNGEVKEAAYGCSVGQYATKTWMDPNTGSTYTGGHTVTQADCDAGYIYVAMRLSSSVGGGGSGGTSNTYHKVTFDYDGGTGGTNTNIAAQPNGSSTSNVFYLHYDAKKTSNKDKISFDYNGGSGSVTERWTTATYPMINWYMDFEITRSPDGFTPFKIPSDETGAWFYAANPHSQTNKGAQATTVQIGSTGKYQVQGISNSNVQNYVRRYYFWSSDPANVVCVAQYSTTPVSENRVISLPTPNTRSGYTFLGWYTEAGSKAGNAGANYTVPAGISKLIARWQQNVSLTVNKNPSAGGSVNVGNGTYAINSSVTLTATPSNGYAFSGWSYSGATLTSGSTGSTTITLKLTGNTTVTANFRKWRVVYNLGQATSGQTLNPAYQEKTYGQKLTLSNQELTKSDTTSSLKVTWNKGNGEASSESTATKTIGYTHDGWATSSSGNRVYNRGGDFTENLTADKNLYPHFSEKTPTVTSVKAPRVTKTGYTFAGWYNGNTLVIPENGGSYTPDANISLTARWNPSSYSVSYDANAPTGTTASGTAPTSHQATYGSSFTAKTNTFSVPGYIFKGWSTSPDGVDTINMIPLPSETNDWVAGYLKSDGSVDLGTIANYDMSSDYIKVTPGQTYTFSYTCSSASDRLSADICGYTSGYQFVSQSGWRDVALGSTCVVTYTCPSNVEYIRVSCRTFNAVTTAQLEQGGSATTYTEYKHDGVAFQPGVAKTWDLIGDRVLYAQWEKAPLAVKYNANYGTVSASGYSKNTSQIISYNGNDSFHTPSITDGTVNLYNFSTFGLTRKGYYVVDGEEWMLGNNASATFDEDVAYPLSDFGIDPSVGGTITVKANWKPMRFNIHFDMNVPDGETLASLPFTDELNMPYSTIDFVPQNAYDEYDLNNWAVLESEGYYFDGFSTSPNGPVVNIVDTVEDPVISLDLMLQNGLLTNDGDEVTLYAVWRPIPVNYSYKIVYDGIDTSQRFDFTGNYGDQITVNASALNAMLSQDGYEIQTSGTNTILVRDDTDGNGTGTILHSYTSMPQTIRLTGDTCIEVRAIEKQNAITYILNGGTNNASNPSTYTASTNNITFAAPAKPGADFLGWKLVGVENAKGGIGPFGVTPGETFTVTDSANTAGSGSVTVEFYQSDGSSIGTSSGTSFTVPNGAAYAVIRSANTSINDTSSVTINVPDGANVEVPVTISITTENDVTFGSDTTGDEWELNAGTNTVSTSYIFYPDSPDVGTDFTFDFYISSEDGGAYSYTVTIGDASSAASGINTVTETFSGGGWDASSLSFGDFFITGINQATLSDAGACQTGDITLEAVWEMNQKELNIVVRDADSGAYVEDAEMQISGRNGILDSWTSPANGSHAVQVSNGAYTIKVLSAPEGYEPLSEPVTVRVTDSTASSITVFVDLYPESASYFVDSNPRGGHYYYPELTTTDDNQGKYLIVETEATDGYMMDGKQIEIDLNDAVLEDGVYVLRVEIENWPNEFLIRKTDPSGNSLPGAVFNVWKEGEERKTYSTDENGETRLYRLGTGTWHYQEIEAPKGYDILDDSIKTFTVDENGYIQGLTNEPSLEPGEDGRITSSVKEVNIYEGDLSTYFEKVSDNGEVLEGVEFRITKPDGTSYTATTDESGRIYVHDLVTGTYTYQETGVGTTDGYIDNTNVYSFTVVQRTNNMVSRPSMATGWVNGYINDTGTVANGVASNYDMTSYFIPVEPGETYTFSYTCTDAASDLGAQIVGYSASKAFVSRSDYSTASAGSRCSVSYTCPQNVAYVRVTCRTYKTVDTMQLEKGSTATEYVIHDSWPEFNLQTVQWSDGYIDPTHGGRTSSAQYGNKTSEFIPVVPGETYTLSYTASNATAQLGACIGGYAHRANNGTVSQTGYVYANPGETCTVTYTAPDNVNYIRLGVRTYNSVDTFTLDRTGAPASQQPEYTVVFGNDGDDRTVVNTTNKVRIMKVDENGDPLEGVKIVLWHEYTTIDQTTGQPMTIRTPEYEGTTNADGMLTDLKVRSSVSGNTIRYNNWTLIRLEKGTWKYQEISAPDGYIVDDTVRTFTVSEDYTINGSAEYVAPTLVNFKNELIIRKVPVSDGVNSVDGIGLSGAVFRVWMEDPLVNYDRTFTTQTVEEEDGIIKISGLGDGTYFYQEITPPAGYVMADNTVHTFTVENGVITGTDITTTGNVSSTSISNKKNMILIVKKDAEGNALEGVTFRIVGPETDRTFTTDENGEYALYELKPGSYTITETATLTGFALLGSSITFTVGADGTITNTTADTSHVTYASASETWAVGGEYTVINDEKATAEITITKRDAGNLSTLLRGAEFKLDYWDGEAWVQYKRLTDNEDGTYTVTNIDPSIAANNRFRLKETKSPVGYSGSYEKIFVITGTYNVNNVFQWDVTNVRNELIVQKITVDENGDPVLDSDGNYVPLKNAEFEIKINDTAYLVGGANPLTDRNGQIKLSNIGDFIESNRNLLRLPTWDEIVACENTNGYYNYPIQLEPNTTYYLSTNYDDGYGGWGKGYVLVSPAKNNSSWKAISHLGQGAVSGTVTTGSSGILYLNVNATQSQWEQVVLHSFAQIKKGTQATEYVPYVSPGNAGTSITVKEVATQGLYYLDDTLYDFTVDALGNITCNNPSRYMTSAVSVNGKITLIVGNEKVQPTAGYVTVTKQNANGDNLTGAGFNIYEWDRDLNDWSAEPIKAGDSEYSMVYSENGAQKVYKNTMALTYTVMNLGKFLVVEDHAPDGYKAEFRQEVTINKDVPGIQNFTFTAVDTPNELIIRKIDENGDALQNVVFSFTTTSEKTSLIEEYTHNYTTDADGLIHIEHLVPGTYEVVELSAPSGMAVDGRVRRIVVDEDSFIYEEGNELGKSQTYTMTVIDGPNSISGKKVNTQGTALPNARFDLYRMSSESDYDNAVFVESATTGDDGIFTFDGLEDGIYYFTEGQAPTGYVGDTAKYRFFVEHGMIRTEYAEIPQGNYMWKQDIVNRTEEEPEEVGSITIFKYDDVTNNPVPGAVFVAYPYSIELGSFNVDEPYTFTYNSALGVYEALDLPVNNANQKGRYLVTETVAPLGYYAAGNFEVVLSDSENNAFTTDVPETSYETKPFVIYKVDAQNAEKFLPGAVFALEGFSTSTGTWVPLRSYTTDSEGKIELTFKDLSGNSYLGTYRLFRVSEIQAPAGYEKSSKTWELSVTMNGFVNGNAGGSLTVPNEASRNIEVGKRILASDILFDNGNPIFMFRLRGETSQGGYIELVKTVEFTKSFVNANTDANGYVTLYATFENLPLGEYTVEEIDVMRYDIESITNVTGGIASGDTGVFDLVNNPEGSIMFTNLKKYWNYLSDTEQVINNVQVGN